MKGSRDRLQHINKKRQLINLLTTKSVSAGGNLVLLTLLLIFFYLLYVVTPIFTSATMTPAERFSVSDNPLLSQHLSSSFQSNITQIDNSGRYGYQLNHAGEIIYFKLPSLNLDLDANIESNHAKDSDFTLGQVDNVLTLKVTAQTTAIASNSYVQGSTHFAIANEVTTSEYRAKEKVGNKDNHVDMILSDNEAAQRLGVASLDGSITLFSPQLEKFIYLSSQTKLRSTGKGTKNKEPGSKRPLTSSAEILKNKIDKDTKRQTIQIAPPGVAIEQWQFSQSLNSLVVVAQTSDKQLLLYRSKVYKNKADKKDITREQVTASKILDLSQQLKLPQQIKTLLLDPNGETLYLLSGHQLYIVDLSQQPTIQDVLDLTKNNSEPSSISLLSGASSLLVTHESEMVSQWFYRLKNGERKLTFIRDFSSSQYTSSSQQVVAQASQVSTVLPETQRKGFYLLQDNGLFTGFYTTNHHALLERQLFSLSNDTRKDRAQAALSPSGERLLLMRGSEWQLFDINNKYPEISLSSLWSKVWYENYPEPDYVWQSSSSDSNFEAKFSLTPLVWGTLKGALYALFFAIPVGVLGAVYTGYFMTDSVRRYIKPTIEIMEAIPTVILGFLAGLWLAPHVENNLPAVVILVLTLPLFFMVIGGFWHLVKRVIKINIPLGFEFIVLLLFILLWGWSAFSLSPWIESYFFAGDLRMFITNELGFSFDQRNALIVGFAMGFAVTPTIFTIAEDAIYSVPKHLSNGSLALGATQWQTLTKVVLLTASPGIFSAIMMGFGRAVGETMIVLMASGNTPVMDSHLFSGLRSLAANIAIESPESEVGSPHYRVLFLAALLLFIFTFVFNTIAEMVRLRLREKYRSL
ncbi:ABC transporter permease subunit [Vibrio sp. SS-MA-C1-2]|uniref:ABC transporter permease subunit n=1 Tax=Vibrio sp. SS-MA-C1-2 TaxID=2908646 RepID=UPI001F3A8277|nr:ABC transporter permease subunit [Vibrio sp. SS-MA-C1-2]UJF18987.1 ABC transporter permease subunit [Vibrio sp. SS-MA-C1-2]